MAFRVSSMQFGPILANGDVVGVAATALILFTAVIHHGVPAESEHIADEFMAQLFAQRTVAGVLLEEPFTIHADVSDAY